MASLCSHLSICHPERTRKDLSSIAQMTGDPSEYLRMTSNEHRDAKRAVRPFTPTTASEYASRGTHPRNFLSLFHDFHRPPERAYRPDQRIQLLEVPELG